MLRNLASFQASFLLSVFYDSDSEHRPRRVRFLTAKNNHRRHCNNLSFSNNHVTLVARGSTKLTLEDSNAHVKAKCAGARRRPKRPVRSGSTIAVVAITRRVARGGRASRRLQLQPSLLRSSCSRRRTVRDSKCAYRSRRRRRKTPRRWCLFTGATTRRGASMHGSCGTLMIEEGLRRACRFELTEGASGRKTQRRRWRGVWSDTPRISRRF